MSDIELDYDYLTHRALRRVVSDVLLMTAELGATPGDHHFYIEFTTSAPGVDIPDDLREAYPDRMTIVLQHQFEDLAVRDDGFSVTLWFKGKQARLTVPFDAISSFADPSVEFGLRFNAALENDIPKPAAPKTEAPSKAAPDAAPDDAEEGGEVVSLDAFRKK